MGKAESAFNPEMRREIKRGAQLQIDEGVEVRPYRIVLMVLQPVIGFGYDANAVAGPQIEFYFAVGVQRKVDVRKKSKRPTQFFRIAEIGGIETKSFIRKFIDALPFSFSVGSYRQPDLQSRYMTFDQVLHVGIMRNNKPVMNAHSQPKLPWRQTILPGNFQFKDRQGPYQEKTEGGHEGYAKLKISAMFA